MLAYTDSCTNASTTVEAGPRLQLFLKFAEVLRSELFRRPTVIYPEELKGSRPEASAYVDELRCAVQRRQRLDPVRRDNREQVEDDV